MVQTLSQLQLKTGFLRIGVPIDFKTKMGRYSSIFVLGLLHLDHLFTMKALRAISM